MTWSKDLEFSKAMRAYADIIYSGVLPIKDIIRYDRNDGQAHILDQTYHIDCLLVLENGQTLTLQEKFLRDQYAKYDCYTLEYFNDPKTGEEGEWHKLCTDLYFTGYGNERDGFASAYLFKTIEVKLAIMRNELKGDLKKVKQGRANFYAYPFRQFKDNWFIYKRR